MPGSVPNDPDKLNRFLNYRRDTGIPKHRVQWNWVADLPMGKGKSIAGNARGALDKLIGGWQLAGIGTLRSTYFSLPTGNWNFTGEPIHQYGYQYPIQDCRGGTCIPGYLWWNGYIPANQINSKDANGKPNGYMGDPGRLQAGGNSIDSVGHNRDAGQCSGGHGRLPVSGTPTTCGFRCRTARFSAPVTAPG